MAAVPGGAAPGGPGTQSYMDTSRKDCFGTAAATDGNVVQTAEVDTAPGQPFTLALGFGADAAAAIGVARASASSPFGSMLGSYVSGWRAYDRTLRRPPASLSPSTRAMYWLSANVIKADEDKTYPGAFVAPRPRIRGVSRCPRRPPIPGGLTVRYSPATATRPSPGCSPTGT